MSRNKKHCRQGMTFIELMVYLVIFTIVMGFIFQLIWSGRKVDAGRKRLGIFQDLRISSMKLTRQLSQATRILFPPADGKPYHQIVFISEKGELMVVYLNDKDKLYLLNYDAAKRLNEEPILLANRTIGFTASRPPGTEDYIQYMAQILDDQDFEFAVTDGLLIRNLIW